MLNVHSYAKEGVAGELPRRLFVISGPSVLLALVLLAVVLLAVGCGGPSPEERFAERVCSTTVPWAEKMLSTYEETRLIRAAPGSDSVVRLNHAALRGKADAKSLGIELKAVPVPDTEAARRAEGVFVQSADRALQIMSEQELHVRGLRLNISLVQSIRELARLELALVNTLTTMTTIPSSIRTAMPTLRDEFETAESCKELEAVGRERD